MEHSDNTIYTYIVLSECAISGTDYSTNFQSIIHLGPSRVSRLIQEGRASIIGPIRQEILSGIRERAQCVRLRDTLRNFPDCILRRTDYERAAEILNVCRRKGIQGSNTDFLICAYSERHEMPI